jgi:protein-disulfide isomerase
MRAILQDLTPPVDPDRDHWRGGAGAAVTLVEYGDYECPYSRAAFRAIQRLEPQLGGQLRFVFRHLPLTRIHPHALAAAHLAEAAALQGRFWPMHELLFGHQQALEDADLWGYADQLGLDRHRLAADLDQMCDANHPVNPEARRADAPVSRERDRGAHRHPGRALAGGPRAGRRPATGPRPVTEGE